MNQASNTLNNIAGNFSTHGDFDEVISYYTGQIIAPQIKDKDILECGCSTGVMTPMLLNSAKSITVVEGSELYAKQAKEKFPELDIHVSLFENFEPTQQFDAIVFAHVLHHIDAPLDLLKKMKSWVKPGGSIHINVPNMTAFHRQMGVKMGQIATVYDDSERNQFFQQPGRFDKEKFEYMVKEAGWNIKECYGFLFKPFPHSMMNEMNIEQKVLDGLFEMGKELEDLACQIYINATA